MSARVKCSVCGGYQPVDRDANDLLTDPEGGYCPGHLTVDQTGQVLGCGAWLPEAYAGDGMPEDWTELADGVDYRGDDL